MLTFSGPARLSVTIEAFVLADESKFGEVAFVKIADLNRATIITDSKVEDYERYAEKTRVEVVTE